MKQSYQQRGGRLATVPPSALRALRDAVRQARASIDDLTPAESQLLSDLADGRGTTMLFRALTVVSRCQSAADAHAVTDAMRLFLVSLRNDSTPPRSPLEVLREETEANAAANAAEIEFLAAPSRATRERLIEVHRRQRFASDALITSIAVGL